MLSACAASTKNLVVVDAVDLRCSIKCETACVDLDVLNTDSKGEASIDDVIDSLVRADAELDECEIARSSCVECIERGRRAGVIK
jgi:hypothetical protein